MVIANLKTKQQCFFRNHQNKKGWYLTTPSKILGMGGLTLCRSNSFLEFYAQRINVDRIEECVAGVFIGIVHLDLTHGQGEFDPAAEA